MKSLFFINVFLLVLSTALIAVLAWFFSWVAYAEVNESTNPIGVTVDLEQEEYAWITFPDACYFQLSVMDENGKEVLNSEGQVCA